MSIYLEREQHEARQADLAEALSDERDACNAVARFAANPQLQLVAAFCRRQLTAGLAPETFAYVRSNIATEAQTALVHALAEAETGVSRSEASLGMLAPHDFDFAEQRRRYNESLRKHYQLVTREYSRLLAVCDALMAASAEAA